MRVCFLPSLEVDFWLFLYGQIDTRNYFNIPIPVQTYFVSSKWCILESDPWAAEKNVCSAVLEWDVLHMPVSPFNSEACLLGWTFYICIIHQL